MGDARAQSPSATPPYISPLRKTPSPQTESQNRPPSPDTCPICLDQLSQDKDRCYSNNCAHVFCYLCLLEWSKNKRECPLCKKPFDSIIHNIKSYDEYDVHKLPPPQSQADPVTRPGWANISWEWMNQMRRMYMRNRRRQMERVQSASYRQPTLSERNVMRPATTDYRRFIYAYGLYCEGANHPSGSQRYRRVSPEFYRRNPAAIHRLVPWLNRELVAILPHRDNVQFVLEHILSQIKRIDMRSEDFYRSIRPFTLSNTDHFVHEFHQFAMSPLDMAGFDTYAKYPRRPRGMNRFMTFPAGSLNATNMPHASTARVNEPPGSSSSSSSDSEIEVSFQSASNTAQSAGASNTFSNSTPDQNRQRPSRFDVPTSEQTSLGYQSTRDYLRSVNPLVNPVNLSSLRTAPFSSLTGTIIHQRLPQNQRSDVNRLERALLTTEGVGSSSYPVYSFTNNPPSTSTYDRYDQLISRVRHFLSPTNAEGFNNLEEVHTSLDMPSLSDLTGEHDSELQPSTSRSQTIREQSVPASAPSTSADWSDVYNSNERRRKATKRPASPTSSHSSDVIFVSEERPYRERTPVMVTTSESEDESPRKPKVFKAALNTKVHRLSGSSESSSSPNKSNFTNTHTRFRSPELSEISDNSDDGTIQTSTNSTSINVDQSSGSDCVVTYESKKKSSKLKSSRSKGKSKKGTEDQEKHSKKHKHKKKTSGQKNKDEPESDAGGHSKKSSKLKKSRTDEYTGREVKGKRKAIREKSSGEEESDTDAHSKKKSKSRKRKIDKNFRADKQRKVTSSGKDGGESDTSCNSKKKSRSKCSKADENSYSTDVPDVINDDSEKAKMSEQSGSAVNAEPKASTSGSQDTGCSWFLDYNNEVGDVSVTDITETHEYPDIRKQIKAFAKSKIEKKYQENISNDGEKNKKVYKKHDRGHKSSNR